LVFWVVLRKAWMPACPGMKVGHGKTLSFKVFLWRGGGAREGAQPTLRALRDVSIGLKISYQPGANRCI
jgi:hypothetical protein